MRLSIVGLLLLALSGCGMCGADDDGAPWQLEQRSDAGVTSDTSPLPDLGPYDAGPTTECGDVPPDERAFSPSAGDVVQARVAIGPAGCPHIGFFENGFLYYGRWDGERWQVEEAAISGGGNWEFDLAVGPDGRPHMVHKSGSPGNIVRHTYRNNDGEWTSTIADQFFLWDINHQISPDGRPVFVAVRTSEEYVGSDPRILYYEMGDDGWTSTEIVDTDQAYYVRNGLEFDPDGRPVIAVAGGDDSDTVFLARRAADGTWQTQTATVTRFAARSAMLAVDGEGRIGVSFCGFDDQAALRVATPTDSGMVVETAFGLGSGCLPGGMVFDRSMRLHVLVNKTHAVRSDGRWREFRFEDVSHDGPQYISTAFDVERGVIHTVTIEDSDEPRSRNAVYRAFPLAPPRD